MEPEIPKPHALAFFNNGCGTILPQPGEPMRVHHVRHIVLVAMSSCDFFVSEQVDPHTTALADIEFFGGDDDGTSLSFDGSWDDVLGWFTTHLDPINTAAAGYITNGTSTGSDPIETAVARWMLHLENTIHPADTTGEAGIILLDNGRPSRVVAAAAHAPPPPQPAQPTRAARPPKTFSPATNG